MGVDRQHGSLARELHALRRPDQGFSTSMGGTSEVEPTTVASLALGGDEGGRRWLAERQRRDGGFDELDGRLAGPTTAALAALALTNAESANRALRYAIAHRGLPPPGATDPEQRSGWGWTSDVRSTVEPTSRVLLAVNVLRSADVRTRREAIRLLSERQCRDGGWNYGNASVNDVDLRGYAQTTAIALIGLQGGPATLVHPGLRFLRQSWRREPGGLTTAQALVAFRLYGVQEEIQAATEALGAIARRPSFREEPLTVAWATLATGPDTVLEPLRSRA
jgi:hypothetical protein